MLTGARCGEARTATFDQFNLDLAIWTKQAAYTKQRRVHRVPISHEAVALIRLCGDAVAVAKARGVMLGNPALVEASVEAGIKCKIGPCVMPWWCLWTLA